MASTRKKAADAATNAEAAPALAEPDLKNAAAAYARLADERKALGERPELPTADLGQILDIARKAFPRLLSLRDAIAEALPGHPIRFLDQLEEYLAAASFSDRLVSLTASSETGSDKFNEMIEEARRLRKLMLTSAEPLVLKGLIEEAKVKAIRSGAGHEDLASDLLELTALYKEAWPRVRNKSPVEQEELDQAQKLGHELTDLLVLRKSDTAKLSPEECAEQRDRAYALLLRAYDETARAVAYLRWHEKDADSFTPSLFKAKRGRPPKGENTASPPPVVEVDDTSKADEAPPI
ncbi:MAG: hypothetical protein MUF64_17010 [Polyangiaceae bacterium]|jgi:hypothetical protein|nr:hypothetical protein [Polyangiaceae bacterium]